jgi:hypothetical protein
LCPYWVIPKCWVLSLLSQLNNSDASLIIVKDTPSAHLTAENVLVIDRL